MDWTLTTEVRADRLLQVAANRDLPDELVDLSLREWAHGALTTEEQRQHLEELARLVRERDGLADGSLDWQAIDPELTCRDRDEAAMQIACERVDEALRPLVYGPPNLWTRRDAA